MDHIMSHLGLLGIAALLLALNAFFVAAEFALVKMRSSRVGVLVEEKRTFAKTLAWHNHRLDGSLAACQLGITLASLGLGWIGEPALAGLLEPLFIHLGFGSPVVIHTTTFILAFSLFTALHIIVGEQVPKIYAIRKAEPTALACSMPLKVFYIASYPFMIVLNGASNFLLARLGLTHEEGHEAPHTEDEIRHVLTASRSAGELTKAEHRLMNRVFEFDEMVCRQAMIPRKDIITIDADCGNEAFFKEIESTLHSRYPVYENSPENVIGLIHVKDLAGMSPEKEIDIRSLLRPIEQVPETMSLSKLLSLFQTSKVHMALIHDEHGSIVGAVTLEDILEELVGSIQDEFDAEPEPVITEVDGGYVVNGSAPLHLINDILGLQLSDSSADTISGFVVDALDRAPEVGDSVLLSEVYRAEILTIDGTRAESIRVTRI